MMFEFDDLQSAWHDEVRAFLAEHATPALVAELKAYSGQLGPEEAAFRRKMGEKGWFGVNWPSEFGGLDKGPVYQHILTNELQYQGLPGLGIEVTALAPVIMRHGTAQNRAEFLPPIARGELTCAVGYSEPDAGTDLASLKTTAELDGDEWVINGQKAWNTAAQRSTHEWLCVRTDNEAPKHKGISVLMVPLSAPGIEIRPLWAWSGARTNEVFFHDVRVPSTNLIGEPNRGWRYIIEALDLERGAVAHVGDLRRAVDDLVAAAQAPSASRVSVASADMRRKIAQLDADVEIAVLMGLETCSLHVSGQNSTLAATAEKIFSSELRQRIADVGTQMFGMSGALAASDPFAALQGKFEQHYRSAPLLRFGGGANEVLRDVIAQRGYGMPRYDR
jgi:alkylation response protein AidB-like acyl-CoA dehydrogenase